MKVTEIVITKENQKVIQEIEVPDDYFSSLDDARASKIAELSSATEQRIFAGLDIETPTFGTLHYPLTDRDQADLSFFNQLILAGQPRWL
jgi:hypothetical protein